MPSFLEFALLFQRALKAIQLYGADHPSTQEGLAALEEAYGELLKERSQLQISARSGRIFVDKVLEEAGQDAKGQLEAVLDYAAAME